jgi:hypothetical protein
MKKRRKFLGYLTTCVMMPFLPVRVATATGLHGQPNAPLIRILAELIPDNPAMRHIGQAALRYSGSVDAPLADAKRLLGDLDQAEIHSPDQLRSQLQFLSAADFFSGDTVTLNGWILARSEAEAIALLAVHRSI